MFEPNNYIVEGTRAYYYYSASSFTVIKHGTITECTFLTVNYVGKLCYHSTFILWKKLKVIIQGVLNLDMVLPKNLLCFIADSCYRTKIVLTKKISVIVFPCGYNEPIEPSKNLRIICIQSVHFNQPIRLPKNLKYFRSKSTFTSNMLFPNHLNFLGTCCLDNQHRIIFPEYLCGLFTYCNYTRLIEALNQNVRIVIIGDKCVSYKYANRPNNSVCLSYARHIHASSVTDERMKFNTYIEELLGIDMSEHTITFDGTFGI